MSCSRRFTLLASGGVRVTWACGAHRDYPDEEAVDVEYLADHLSAHHHHLRWHRGLPST